jgi:hypothetical protein
MESIKPCFEIIIFKSEAVHSSQKTLAENKTLFEYMQLTIVMKAFGFKPFYADF